MKETEGTEVYIRLADSDTNFFCTVKYAGTSLAASPVEIAEQGCELPAEDWVPEITAAVPAKALSPDTFIRSFAGSITARTRKNSFGSGRRLAGPDFLRWFSTQLGPADTNRPK